MLVEWVLDLILGLIEGLTSFLPEAEPLGLDDLSGWFHGYAFINTILPVDTVLACAVTALAVDAAIWLYGFFREIWGLVPFFGKSS